MNNRGSRRQYCLRIWSSSSQLKAKTGVARPNIWSHRTCKCFVHFGTTVCRIERDTMVNWVWCVPELNTNPLDLVLSAPCSFCRILPWVLTWARHTSHATQDSYTTHLFYTEPLISLSLTVPGRSTSAGLTGLLGCSPFACLFHSSASPANSHSISLKR